LQIRRMERRIIAANLAAASRDGSIIMSPSDPIRSESSADDRDVEPSRRQAANHHRPASILAILTLPPTFRPRSFTTIVAHQGEPGKQDSR
jgi:hypothetical protein